MSSSCIVPVVEIKNVRVHSNADKLEVCDVLGYQMCIGKGQYKDGDRGVYFPADVLIPKKWAEKFNVLNFLRGKDKDRVGKIKLRGEPSFGLIVPVPPDQNWELGYNAADYFECKKYEPPIRPDCGDAEKYDSEIDPLFDKYCDIENGRIFTDVFSEKDNVIVTEKIHGTNCRIGFVNNIQVAGSMELRRKKPENQDDMERSIYWSPWNLLAVQKLMNFLKREHNVVIMYGEVYGGSIQSLDYGRPKGKGFGYKAFDLKVDGKFLDWLEFNSICCEYEVSTVPLIYQGPFIYKDILQMADGKTLVQKDLHMREGVVVKSIKEKIHPKIGRSILKYIGTEYSLANNSDFKDV